MSRSKDMKRKVVVRVDDDLYEALVRDAEQNDRTISQTVRHKLRELCNAAPAYVGGTVTTAVDDDGRLVFLANESPIGQ